MIPYPLSYPMREEEVVSAAGQAHASLLSILLRLNLEIYREAEVQQPDTRSTTLCARRHLAPQQAAIGPGTNESKQKMCDNNRNLGAFESGKPDRNDAKVQAVKH